MYLDPIPTLFHHPKIL
uniref:Uncharacterized protein n=1 Tax=Arundo donax TaxID=35708 RepID=A0A0A9BAL5_ARUDO